MTTFSAFSEQLDGWYAPLGVYHITEPSIALALFRFERDARSFFFGLEHALTNYFVRNATGRVLPAKDFMSMSLIEADEWRCTSL